MQIQTRVDSKCVKEYTKSQLVVWIIFCVIGFLYVVGSVISASINNLWSDVLLITSLIFGVFIFIVSGVAIIKILSVFKATDAHAFDTIYDFGDDCIVRKAILNGEQVSELKVKYSDIIYYKVSANYIFLVIYTKQYYPVDKSGELEEFIASKGLIRK